MTSRPPAWIVALYRRLARAAPARWRDRLPDDQTLLFDELWCTERPRGWIRGAAWTAAMFARAGIAVLAMHVDAHRRGGRGLRRGVVAADLRHALRSLRRAPWYSLTFTAITGAGIALAATVFALVDGVLFKPLPYRAPDELYVIVGGRVADRPIARQTSRDEVEAFRRAVPEARFTAFGAIVGNGTLGVINGPTVWRWLVDREFWGTLGVQPAIGGFAPGDVDAAEAPRPVVITYRLWHRIFGDDRGVLGRRLDVGRNSYRIAGILPRGFIFPTADGEVAPDLLEAAAGADPGEGSVIARIPRHVPAAWVEERLIAAAARLPRAGGDGGVRDIDLLPLREVLTSTERGGSLLAFGAVTMLVLLVAVNLGGLTAGHVLDRGRELAARRALGASAFDVARLQLVEVGILMAVASAAGLALARVLLIETARRLPSDIVLLREPALDGRVIAAAAAAAAFVAITVMVAAHRVLRTRPLSMLLGQGAGAPVDRVRTAGRALLQGGQVALAMLLVVGGTLFLASVRNLWRADTGYTMTDALYLDVRVGGTPGTAEPLARALDLLEVLRAVPGVEQAGIIDTFLLSGWTRGSPFRPPRPDAANDAELMPISSGFFALAGLRAIDGRLPTDAELDAGAPVAVVSRSAARDFWPDRSAVGQFLVSSRATLSVVGVVPDARYQALDRASAGEIYAPIRLALRTGLAPTYLVGTALPEGRVMPVLIDTIRRFDPAASIRRAQPVSAALAESIRRQRFHAWLFGGLAVASLIVAAAGILGLVAMATARRTREMGVRLALGSTHDRLVRLLLREQLPPVGIGLAAGGLVAAWAVGFVRAMLYEISAYDLRVWGLAAALVLLAAGAGTLIPAARLRRIDAVAVLRAD